MGLEDNPAGKRRKELKMDKTKIIVVEDNIVYCEFVCNLLAREKFRTVQAFHLSTAKKLLQQATDNDIVVSDLRLAIEPVAPAPQRCV